MRLQIAHAEAGRRHRPPTQPSADGTCFCHVVQLWPPPWAMSVSTVVGGRAAAANTFIKKNADGATVNRWLTTGFLAASASSNESGYITHKAVRSTGILAFDNQARV